MNGRLDEGCIQTGQLPKRVAQDGFQRAEIDSIADPLCGWDASVGMWAAVFDFVFAGADDRNFAATRRGLPFHLVGGGADPESERGRTVTALAERLKRMGFSNLVSTIYPETRHESLNELNRDVIMADFADWVDRSIAA